MQTGVQRASLQAVSQVLSYPSYSAVRDGI
jgi:hypothetical protein